MEVRRPAFDNSGNRGPVLRKGLDIAADTEESSSRGEKNCANITAFAKLDGELLDLFAEGSIDRIAAVRLVQSDAGEPFVNHAFDRVRAVDLHLEPPHVLT